MRQTSDDNAMFVPQYRYETPSAFPNRNALSPPTLAQPPKTADGSLYLSTASFGSRAGGSILNRPPSALLRSPVTGIPQGDNAYDRRPATSYAEMQRTSDTLLSKSYNDVDSLMHPALRNDSKAKGPIREVVSMGSLEAFGRNFTDDTPFKAGAGATRSQRSPSEDWQRVTYDSNLLQPPQEAHRTSWDRSGFLNNFPVRPKQFLRRSLTPRLYNPQDVSLDSESKTDQGGEMAGNRERQKTIGRMLLAVCLLFPPLWFVLACGGLDSLVATWTGGAVRGVGSTEKKIALALASVVCVGAVVGIVVGITVGAAGAPK